jgi:SagB-type dehydrogenase family enzyme
MGARASIAASAAACVIVLGSAGCSSSVAPEAVGPRPGYSTPSALPEPGDLGGVTLADALAARRSVRQFGEAPLTDQQVSALLWAAQGVTSASGGRTAPSAGALYPLEVYVVTDGTVLHYLPDGHRAESRESATVRAGVADAVGQEAARAAPAVVVIAAVPARVEPKYGGRAERYLLLEAGHAAQNLLLAATALGLGAVPIGAFGDEALARALDLPPGEETVYAIPVGPPSGGS